MAKEKKTIKNFSDEDLKNKTKKLLMTARKKGLIKSHVLAFEDTPVEQEEHKGKFICYVSN